MIQEPIKNILQNEIRGLTWSIDNRTADDNTGTVYYDGGSKPSIYEDEMRYPYYQVYIRSSDFDKAFNAAQRTYELLHRKDNFFVDVPIYENGPDEISRFESYKVHFIEALSEPLRIGVEDNVMEYSINVQATLRKQNNSTQTP